MVNEERQQLIIVRDNLFRGMSKSMQKLQARAINEVLGLPNYTQSAHSDIKSGTDIHAGDGGYSIGTRENYEAFVKVRNESLNLEQGEPLGEVSGLYFDKQGFKYPHIDWLEHVRFVKVGMKIYTAPQQRTWVDLTLAAKEEYLALDFGGNRLDAMDWAARRLKEKNT